MGAMRWGTIEGIVHYPKRSRQSGKNPLREREREETKEEEQEREDKMSRAGLRRI